MFDNFGKEKVTNFSDFLKQNLKQVKVFPHSFSFFQNTDIRKFIVNPYITVVCAITQEMEYV